MSPAWLRRRIPNHGGYATRADSRASMLCGVLLAILVAVPGCEKPPAASPLASAPATSASPAGGHQTEAPASPQSGASKDWYALYIGKAKVGYSFTSIEPDESGPEKTVKLHSVNEIRIQRGPATVPMRLELTSHELSDGKPLSFTATQSDGSSTETTRGKWHNGELSLEVARLGRVEQKSLPWRPDDRGVFAKELSLRARPLVAGGSRSFTMLMPFLNVVGRVHLEAKSVEQTSTLSGSAQLLRVECTEVAGQNSIRSTLWTDQQGRIVKLLTPQLNMVAYRTTEAIATGKSDGPAFDLFNATIVKLDRRLRAPHKTSRITYKATVSEGTIADTFVSGPSQSVELVSDTTALVTVQAIRTDRPARLAAKDEPPTDADRGANNLVQTGDPKIKQWALSVVPDERDPWKVAVALESFVNRTVAEKNFSRAFASAAEVAASREGDCTEHAVLLMALCRARGIPARGAMGLVYFENQRRDPGFAYHMWTEVWIDGRWIPLDATLGLGGIGAAHLKLAHSNLKGADAYSAFLPVLNVLGKLRLEVVNVD